MISLYTLIVHIVGDRWQPMPQPDSCAYLPRIARSAPKHSYVTGVQFFQLKLVHRPWRRVGSWGIAPLILKHGTGWWWVVSFTPGPLYPYVRTPGAQLIGDRLGTRDSLGVFWEKETLLPPPGIKPRSYYPDGSNKIFLSLKHPGMLQGFLFS